MYVDRSALAFELNGPHASQAAFDPRVLASVCWFATDVHSATLGKGKNDDSLVRVRNGELTGKGELVVRVLFTLPPFPSRELTPPILQMIFGKQVRICGSTSRAVVPAQSNSHSFDASSPPARRTRTSRVRAATSSERPSKMPMLPFPYVVPLRPPSIRQRADVQTCQVFGGPGPTRLHQRPIVQRSLGRCADTSVVRGDDGSLRAYCGQGPGSKGGYCRRG